MFCETDFTIYHEAKKKKKKKKKCVFQVSRPDIDFCSDPKHFIVNCEQNVVKFAEKWVKMYWKMQFLYKIFWQNKMLCRPTIPSFFRPEIWNTHILCFGLGNSFKSLLSDQVIALEWGIALEDVLCLFFWKSIALNGKIVTLIFIWYFIFFLLKGLVATSRLM